MQMITFIHQIFSQDKTPGVSTKKLWLRPYEILATGPGCGILEFLPDTLSIDYLKRKMIEKGGSGSLSEYFEVNFGKIGTPGYVQAQKNFADSLAAYSLVSYILQLRDRHNGNILINKEGHLVHIDFGFMLTNSPLKGI
jgi:phosphatidylinositol 4-kinase B